MSADHPTLDISRIQLQPLSEREHDLDLSVIRKLIPTNTIPEAIRDVAERIIEVRNHRSSVIMMMGAHVLRSGVQRYIIDLMKKGYISCIATNGACVIHDYEFALIGKTTESVSKYIQDGRFGFWQETGRINDIVKAAAKENMGIGEAVGKAIVENSFPHQDISLYGTCFRNRVPITVHVGIGYDITHQHPNCDGAAYGAASYIDFLRLAKVIENLEGGVLLVFGSSVMAPEVFLKGLSMARNVARQKGKKIRNFTILVCDIQALPENFHAEAAKEDPAYYFRPWKTLLIRAVANGGESFYVQGNHSQTIPALWTAVQQVKGKR